MGSTRFFLADLPQRTTEHDLRSLFQDYGDVERVELKTKEQFVDSGQTQAKIIAFVTVYTEDAQYCKYLELHLYINKHALNGCQV